MRNSADKIKQLSIHLIKNEQYVEKLRHFKISCPQLSSQIMRIKSISRKIFKLLPFFHYASLIQAPDMSRVIIEIENAFSKGIYPEVNYGGTSESYVLKDCDGYPIAIFKPITSLWGSDAKKEIAAYRLDHFHFAKVPPTVMASFSHPFFKGGERMRYGSCQWYVNDSITALHVEQRKITKVPEEYIRRIAILDIRLINPDRHTSNLLYCFTNNQIELIPIDHGAVLPETLFSACFGWINWDQAKTAFTSEELNYIMMLDPLADAKILIEELQIGAHAVENMIGATCLLKEAAQRGYKACEIGNMMLRSNFMQEGKRIWQPSLLESIMKETRETGFYNWAQLIKTVSTNIEKSLNYAAC